MTTSAVSPPRAEATPCGWSKDAVQRFAAEAAHKLGYRSGGDLERIVQQLGGRIVGGDDWSSSNTGSITVFGPQNFEISLSSYSGNRRSRFTIAHELAHYILHSRMGEKPLYVRRDGSDRVEWEANWFAAGFLMPEAEFRAKCEASWGDAELAEHFDVSEAAVQIRRQSL